MPRDTLRTPIVLIPVELAAAALYEIDASVPDLAPAALVGTATAVLDEARDLVVEMDRHLAADLPVAVSGDPLLSEEMADTMAVVAGAIGVFNVTIQALQNLDMSGFSEPDIRDYLGTLDGTQLQALTDAVGRIEDGQVFPGDEPIISAMPGWTFLIHPIWGPLIILKALIMMLLMQLIFVISEIAGGPAGPEAQVMAGPMGPTLGPTANSLTGLASRLFDFDRLVNPPSNGGTGGSTSGGPSGGPSGAPSGGSTGSAASISSASSSVSLPSSSSSDSSSSSSSSESSSQSSSSRSSSPPSHGSSWPPDPSTGSSASTGSTCPYRIRIVADTNRDGTVDKVSDDGASSQDTKKRVFNRTFGATCLVNSDNDANESPPSGQHHNKDHDDDVVPIVPPNDEVELAEILVFKPDLTPDIPVSESVRVYIGIEPVPDVQFEQWLSNNGAVEVASRIRIFRKEDNGTYTRLLGKAGDGTTAGTAIYQITDSEDIAAINTDGLTLYVEGCDYASDCMICVSVYLLNELCKKDSVRMMPAPFLIVPQNRPLEMITAPRIQPYIVPSNTNLNSHAPMHSRIQDKVQNNTLEELYKFTGGASSVYRDVFPRDEWRLGTQSFPLGLQTTDPGCRGSMRVGLDLPRGRAAEQFGTDELTGRTVVDGTQDGPDEPRDHGGWSEFNLEGAESPQDAGDYGGNIEVTPPTTAFPLGLVTVGDSLADERIKKFLTRQRAQLEKTNGSYQYLALDAKWLKTGHVDELFNFLPGSAAPFKAVVPSPAAARQVLNDIAGDDDEVVWGNYATFFYGNWAEREEAGMVTSATSTSLTDDNKSFHSNFGQGNGYVRIWAGKGKGQVAEVASISNNGKTLNVGVVFRIPNAVPDPDTGQDLTYSEAIRRYRAGDVKANYAINFTNKSTPPGWLEEPDSTSRYVVVESSQNWGPPYDIPAIVTAQELRQDADLWNKNVDWTGSATARVQGVRDDLQNKLGAGNVQFVEVPALFMTQAAGNQALANRDVQVRLTAFGHTPDAKYRAWNHAARAMLPHMTNLMNISSQTSWVAPGPDAEGIVLSRPFGPRRPGTLGAQDGTDVIMEAAMTALGAGNVAGPVSGLVDADFVDIWNTRHLSDGHAHCGTNARRVPDTEMRQWWSQWPL